jgi:hypothetical protein
MDIRNMEFEDFLKEGVSEKVGEFFRHIGEGLERPFWWLWKYFVFKKEYSYLTENEQFELEGKELEGFYRGRTFRKVGSLFFDIGRYLERPFWWLWNYFTFKEEYEYLTEKEQQYLRDKCLEKNI